MAGSVEDWKDKSIPTTFQQNTAVSDPAFVKSFQQFDVSSPHPGYGKDPNIINEYGHTIYPKMIYPDGKDMPGKVVEDEAQENELMGIKPAELRQDGPTIEQYVDAGLKADTYPPKGYAPISSPEEVKAAIDRQNKPAW